MNTTLNSGSTPMAGIVEPSTVLLLVVTAVAIVFSSVILSRRLASIRKMSGRAPVPPGSLGWPLLGETLDFMKHMFANTMPTFHSNRQAKYGPTFKTHIMGVPVVVIDPPVGNKFVFTKEGKELENSWNPSIKALLGPYSLIARTGLDYKVSRRHLAGFLTPVAVGRYLTRVERNVLELLAKSWQPPPGVPDDHEFKVSAHWTMKKFAFRLIAELCLGLGPGPDSDELESLFVDWSSGFFSLPVNLPGFAFRRAIRARASIVEILERGIARRRVELKEGKASPTQDILTCLLTQPDENGRVNSDDEVKDNVIILLFAGHDTTTSVLAITILYIALHPEVRQRLKEEHEAIAEEMRKCQRENLTLDDLGKMKYTWQVCQETLRMQAPVPGGFRELTTDVEYKGYTLLKGWKVLWTSQTTHENPKFFQEPKKFDPSRFEAGKDLVPYTYVPFGGGPRVCPGSDFAKQQLLVMFHHLLRRYEWTLDLPDEPVHRYPTSMPQTTSGSTLTVRKLKSN